MNLLSRISFILSLLLVVNCSSDSDTINEDSTAELITCVGDVFLTSQEEVDAFGESGCQKIEGFLIIQDEWDGPNSIPDIFDLSPLSNIVEVTGYINVSRNNTISNLNGLHNLERVGQSLVISENQGLVEINEFNNLESIKGELLIEFHDNLETISGFNNLIFDPELDSASSSFGLTIQFNAELQSISGFNQLQGTASALSIRDNLNLMTINGFNNFTSTGFDFYVVTNPLSTVDAFSNLETVGSDFSLWGTDLTDLSMFSSLRTVGGRFWLDYNPLLMSFNGLNNLESTGAIRIGYFEGHENLQSISALNNLVSASSLHMQGNPSLPSLDGLQNLSSSIYEIDIYDNSSLTDFCALETAVATTLALDGSVVIFNNGFNPTLEDFESGTCSNQ
jgi:hypothetical protein